MVLRCGGEGGVDEELHRAGALGSVLNWRFPLLLDPPFAVAPAFFISPPAGGRG